VLRGPGPGGHSWRRGPVPECERRRCLWGQALYAANWIEHGPGDVLQPDADDGPAEPITLNSGGYPTTNGTTEALIYGGAFDFKFVLYNAGTGNTCNGSSVGSLVWTKDPVFDYGKTVEASVAAAVAALPVFASGTYTPTCTGISNIASITSVSPHNYRRVGDTVWVMGAALVDPTSTSTSSSYRCTIPIASDTSPGNRLRGVTNGAGIGFEMWGISSGANDEAYVSFYTGSDAGALTMTHYFMYEIH
jgi:hypothetical protein